METAMKEWFGAEDKRSSSGVRQKRSTTNGSAREKWIAGLTQHHQYESGSCLNWEPIGCNQLARKAKVTTGTASLLFKEMFGSHRQYKAACCDRDGRKLIDCLRKLNCED